MMEVKGGRGRGREKKKLEVKGKLELILILNLFQEIKYGRLIIFIKNIII
jgi:hypothetical protein